MVKNKDKKSSIVPIVAILHTIINSKKEKRIIILKIINKPLRQLDNLFVIHAEKNLLFLKENIGSD